MGACARRGLELWAEDARAELLVRDDRSDARTARREVEDLLPRVDLLAGPYSSGLTRAVAPIAEAHGFVLWNHGGAADDIHAQGLRAPVGVLTPASRYFEPALRWVAAGA